MWDRDDGEHRWQERRVASWLLRGLVLVAPVAASMAIGLAFARAVARPPGVAQIGWWLALLAISGLVLAVVERVTHKLLPLAALLRLTLIFPDRAPSRMGVALRTMSVRRMQDWADEVADDGRTTDIAAHATQVLSLAAALSTHDRRTRGHSERVRALTAMVADQLGLDEETSRNLVWAALLHDIGKISVPREILNKAGKPDDREWAVLQRHPAEGARIAGPLEAWLGSCIGAIGEHHEKFDGSGYPKGLSAKEISLAGRVVSVTDSFETMTALRAYKRPMSIASARKELVQCSGTHFDPVVVRAFFNISLGRLYWKVGIASWLAQLPIVGLLPRAGAEVVSIAAGSAVPATVTAGVAAMVVGTGLSIGAPPPADASSGAPTTAPSPGSGQGTGATQSGSGAGSDDGAGTRAAGARADGAPATKNGPTKDTGADASSTKPTNGDTTRPSPSAPDAPSEPVSTPSTPVPAPARPPKSNPSNGGAPPGPVNNPGNGGTLPGQGGTPSGQINNPGNGGTPPGQGGTPPDQVNRLPKGNAPPGQAKK